MSNNKAEIQLVVRTCVFIAALLAACGSAWPQNGDKSKDGAAPPPTRSAEASRAARTSPQPQALTNATSPPPGANRTATPQTNRQSGGSAGGPGRRRPEAAQDTAPRGQQRGAAGGSGRTRPETNAGATQRPAPSGRQQGGTAGATGERPATARGGAPSRFEVPPRTVTARSGVVGTMDNSGRITSIRGNGLTINRGARGERTIISRRTDQTRLVSFGQRSGFVERPLVRNGRPYIQRTYVTNRGVYGRVYRGGFYHGFLFYHYVPPFFFAPSFYGWVYRPWAFRVVFHWGWGPWLNSYRYYFAPYPYYLDASMWLTDYVISQQLQDAYDAGYYRGQQTQGYASPWSPAPSSYAPLTPELKQAITDEVRAQLAAESSSAANPAATRNAEETPDALDPKIRTFIVSAGLTEQLANGAECFLAPGDVLTRIDDTADTYQNVRVLVSSSQANDCPAGSQIMVGVQDLQDMHNTFRERLDTGLDQLAQTQGKNGIPSGPAANPTPFAEGSAQPDPSAPVELQQQQRAAQQAEQDVQDAARED